MRNSMGLSVLAVALAATPALSLEKTTARVIERGEKWNAATGTFYVRYYNYCTGWTWVWSDWDDGDQVAVNFAQTCYNSTYLVTTWQLTFHGVPSGYGFTGTIEARTPPGCGGYSNRPQPYLPPVGTGWNAVSWGGLSVHSNIEIAITWRTPPGYRNPIGLASDRPLAGPSGPVACGTCYPTTRTTHSRYYGVNGAYCPSGIRPSDALCDVEWMIDAVMACDFAVQDESWGKIKSLYR